MSTVATFSVVRSSIVSFSVSSKISKKKKAISSRFSFNLPSKTTLLTLKIDLWQQNSIAERTYCKYKKS